jgi:hypothetical protein
VCSVSDKELPADWTIAIQVLLSSKSRCVFLSGGGELVTINFRMYAKSK